MSKKGKEGGLSTSPEANTRRIPSRNVPAKKKMGEPYLKGVMAKPKKTSNG